MKNLLIFGAIILSLFASGVSTYDFVHPPVAVETQSFGAFNPTGGGTYYLQASINSTQTTMTLTSFTEPSSNIPYTMSYLNSSIEYGTINPNSPTSEFISFTGITQNTNGTALLTGVTRGLGRSYPYTASTTLAHSVPGQTQFILSSPPQFFNQYYALANNATSSGILVFGSTTPPRYDADPVWANFGTNILADVAYVNSVVAAGAANASTIVKGIIQIATAVQTAAGTATGSTGALLVPPNSLFNATQSATTIIPVTNTSGKLSQAFLDLTQAFTWSGLHTFTAGLLSTASSTFSATTSIQASNVLSNALKLNGIALQFPSTQCPSGQTWINNGSGVLTCGFTAKYSMMNTSSLTDPGGGFATSTTIFGIPAGTLTASSTITVIGNLNCNGNSQTCTYYLRDTGGTTFAQCVVTSNATSDVGPLNMFVANQSSLTSQASISNCSISNGSTYSNIGVSTNTSSFNTANALNLVMVVNGTGSSITVLTAYSIAINP